MLQSGFGLLTLFLFCPPFLVQRCFSRVIHFRSDNVDHANVEGAARIDRLEPEKDQRRENRHSNVSPQKLLHVQSRNATSRIGQEEYGRLYELTERQVGFRRQRVGELFEDC